MAIITQSSGLLDKVKVSPIAQRVESWLRQRLYATPSVQQAGAVHCSATYHSGVLTMLVKNDSVLSQHEFPLSDFSDSSAATIRKWAEHHQLLSTPITFILTLDEYQLFLVDSIVLQEGEHREALKWRIKELIHQPIDELSIDYFELPAAKNSKNIMYDVVVVKEKLIRSLKQFFKSCRMHLETITIPELALRNLTSVFENDLKSTALFYLGERDIVFNISREKQLFLTKKIPIRDYSQAIDSDCPLEIQRYFDYFQNQWRHPKPSRIVFFSSSFNQVQQDFLSRMEERLAIKVEPFPIESLIRSNGYIMENEHISTLLFSEMVKDLAYVEAES